MLYHGTAEADLPVLLPTSRDREGTPVLYLTDNRAYGLFYIRDREIDFVTCGIRRDGVVQYEEKFPNQLAQLYGGRSGYLYETDAQAEQTGIPGIWLCRDGAQVRRCTFVPDVYEAILREIRAGTVELLAWEALSPEQRRQTHESIVSDLLRLPATGKKERFYREHFPEAWEEAKKILAQRE